MSTSASAETPTAPSGSTNPVPSPSEPKTSLIASIDPQGRAVIFCLAGLFIGFIAPWGDLSGGTTGATFYRFSIWGYLFWGIPLCCIATIAVFKNKDARRRFSTITAIVAWIVAGLFTLKALPFGFWHIQWGVSLTFFSSFWLFVSVRDRSSVLAGDFVARKLKTRTAEVYAHWGTPIPDLHFSAQEFYTKIENSIYAKKWPGVQLLRVHYTEAGLLSHKREYLRVIRQRHLFDICAAPFGTDYFFTLREGEIPSVLSFQVMIAAMFSLGMFTIFIIQFFGLLFGPFALLFFVCVGIWFLFNTLRMGLTNVDAMLMRLPVLGTIYEKWFRKETFFQQDSRILFLQSINALVKDVVEETTSGKGIKYLDCFERQPILDGLYKRSRINLNPSTEPSSAL